MVFEVLHVFLKSAISSNSIMIALLGYSIVFLALVLLYTIFYFMPKILSIAQNRKKNRKGTGSSSSSAAKVTLTGEVNAAICMAMLMYFNEIHDEEDNIMTIKKVSKTYSPWSSKIYSVRNYFNRI